MSFLLVNKTTTRVRKYTGLHKSDILIILIDLSFVQYEIKGPRGVYGLNFLLSFLKTFSSKAIIFLAGKTV